MTEAKIYVPTTEAKSPARTYNQVHSPRKYTPGGRRVSIYVCFFLLACFLWQPTDVAPYSSASNSHDIA